MQIVRYESPVLFGQVSLHDGANPDFPLWTAGHVRQGFAWRDGHVSFTVPDRDGECDISLHLLDRPEDRGLDILRAIVVPFSTLGPVRVATIGEEHAGEVPAGDYRLEFRLRPGAEADRRAIEMILSPGPAEFAILCADAEMDRAPAFEIGAEPA